MVRSRSNKPEFSEGEIRHWSKERLEAEIEDAKPTDWEYLIGFLALFSGGASLFGIFWLLKLRRREKEYERLRSVWKEML